MTGFVCPPPPAFASRDAPARLRRDKCARTIQFSKNRLRPEFFVPSAPHARGARPTVVPPFPSKRHAACRSGARSGEPSKVTSDSPACQPPPFAATWKTALPDAQREGNDRKTAEDDSATAVLRQRTRFERNTEYDVRITTASSQ